MDSTRESFFITHAPSNYLDLFISNSYIQAELTHQLLSDFDKSEKLSVQFNLSDVRCLQDDQNKLFNRLATAYKADFMKRSEVRSKIGLLVDKSDEVYIHQIEKLTSDRSTNSTVES